MSLAALLAFLIVAAPPAELDGTRLRAQGVSALADLLPLVDDADIDLRTRARRIVREIALDFWISRTPADMRFIPGPVEVSRDGVTCPQGFYLGWREVTVGEFAEFRKAGGAPAWRGDASVPSGIPVTHVTLHEARAYAEWRGARLPTRRELEVAARGGDRALYPWGDGFDPRRANTREAGLGGPEPAGSRPFGHSVHGVADLIGNVAEWTTTGEGEKALRRFDVLGGSWRRPGQGMKLVTYRLRADERQNDVGFRLAQSLPRPQPSFPAPCSFR